MKNRFDRTPHTMKDWLLLAAGVAAVFAAADWLPGVLRGAGAFLRLLAPFGWGLLLAYVLDIPTRFLRKSSLAAGAAGQWPSAMRCFSVRWRCWRRSSSRSLCRA
ncbi:hypothetical protein NIA69_20750 [Gemmiger formicilis]|nr:hypothetical protein [Gemmiger formicilis]